MKNKFSQEILADKDAYYMSCPEIVGKHLAKKLLEFNSCVELCCAVGALSIQLAQRIRKVFAVDINPSRIINARANANLYGVDNIKFIEGDVLDENLLKKIKAEVAILDPDWSPEGAEKDCHVSDLEKTQPSLKKMFSLTKKYITKNIVLRIPKTFSFKLLQKLGKCDVENIIWNNSLKFKLAYFLENANNREENVDFGDI